MRPKLLKMTAFGPYGGEQIVDFMQLEDANMFLIYGPTGGGKTTILDAICYALYGETNGGERSGENMRSKFAEEGVITEVELFFKLRNEEYRIIRRPQYERAPKKGKSDKLIKVPAEVEFYKEEDGEYKIITSKYNEAGEKINELLHFNIGQFRQVIMIAQNKFRELLTVSSKERQQILQDIFETGIYQNVEKSLDKLSASAKNELHDQEANYKAIMDTIAPNDHEMLNTYMQTKVIYNAPEVCEILETICKVKYNEKEKIEVKLLEISEAITKSQEELAKLTQMANDTLEKVKLEEHLKILKEQEAEFKTLKEKVTLAEKAKGIIPLEEVVMKLRDEVLVKQNDQEKYKAELKDIEEFLKAKEEELKLNEKLIDEAAGLRKEVNVLETYVPKVLELNEAYKRESDLSKQLDKYENGYKKLEEILEAVKIQISNKQEEIKEKSQLQKKSTELYMLQREMEDALKLVSERASREREAKVLFNNLQGIYKEIEVHDKVYNACESEYRDAFSIWFNGQAAELAQTLEENTPCPVCGSLRHPKKAVLTDNHITKEELEKIETAKKQAETRLAKLKQESAAQEAKCTAVKNQIDDYNEKIKAKGNITEESKEKLDNDIEILKSKISRLEELEKSLDEDNKKLKESEERKENGKNFIEKAKLDLNEQRAAIKSIEKDVPEELRNQEALEKKIEGLKREYELKEKVYKELGEKVETLRKKQAQYTTRLEETKKHLGELKKQGVEQKETLKSAILSAGFENKEAYKASKLSDLAIENGKRKVEIYTHDQVVSEEKYKVLQKKTKRL
ncbi:AAA family ATPase [Cellulosilyticum ruminicola]|uniref:AAA family ATPase n=1 Tax=Cellulosilyticum ruminicola TaxID=425254 RepID=UPI0006D1673A|nr:AAA family ATPase [Cellulosilyticum ruminicola]